MVLGRRSKASCVEYLWCPRGQDEKKASVRGGRLSHLLKKQTRTRRPYAKTNSEGPMTLVRQHVDIRFGFEVAKSLKRHFIVPQV